MENPLPKELFEILVCPTCKSNLEYTKNKESLKCIKCKNIYKIKEGIPILLP